MAASFEDFVTESVDGLLRTAYLITSDEGEAEDLVQECLLMVARRWGRIRRMNQPLAYARRVLINLALRGTRQRSRRRAELAAETVEASTSSAGLELLATRDEVRAALRQLAPRQRAVLVLRYFNDLSEAEVAKMLGCTTGTIKSTASRSLAQLRELIQPDDLQTRSARL